MVVSCLTIIYAAPQVRLLQTGIDDVGSGAIEDDREDLSEVSAEQHWDASHWSVHFSDVPQCAVHGLVHSFVGHRRFVNDDGCTVLDDLDQSGSTLDGAGWRFLFVDIEGDLESAACIVRPPGKSVAAMPLEAVASAILPFDRILFNRRFKMKVFPVPPDASRNIKGTSVFPALLHHDHAAVVDFFLVS